MHGKDGEMFARLIQDLSYQSQSSGRYARMEPARGLMRKVLKAMHDAKMHGGSLHERFGVSANTFRLYIKGLERMPSRLLVQISDALEVTPDVFHVGGAGTPARPEIIEASIMFAAHVGMEKMPERLLNFLHSQLDLVKTLENEALDDMPDHWERFKQIKDITQQYAPKNTYGVHWMRDIGEIREDVLGMVDFATKGVWLHDALHKQWQALEDAAVVKVCDAAVAVMGMRDAQPWADAFLVQAKKMGFDAARLIACISPDAVYPVSQWDARKQDAFFDAYRQWWDVRLGVHHQTHLRVNKEYQTKRLFRLRQWAAHPQTQVFLDAEINARYIEAHTDLARKTIKQVFVTDAGAARSYISPSRRLDAWQKLYGPI